MAGVMLGADDIHKGATSGLVLVKLCSKGKIDK